MVYTVKVASESHALAKGHGVLAQLGEHLPYKQRVIGSSPIGPIDKKNLIRQFYILAE